ncbi:PAS domain-containing protein [Thermodesulfobacteriota bacterium]
MVSQLAETTVKKEKLEVSEERLKTANANLLDEISERERAQEALKESEEKFRSIVENSHNGIAILDDKYRVVYINNELCRIIEYLPEELIDQDFDKYMSEEGFKIISGQDTISENDEKAMSNSEFKMIRKGGEERDVEARGSVITDSAGNMRTIVQILDITARKLAREWQKQQ